MKNGSDPFCKLSPSPSFSKTAREWILSSALYDGIEDEDIRQIETLLAERGASPNVLLPEYGITPFHLAVANDSTNFAVQATDICLQHGADPNVRSEDGLTPVHLAAMWGCADVLKVLLASGGDPWLVDCFNKNAFDYAQQERETECLKILNTYCVTRHKPSSHSKSPYQLNLKRVILYKNDLQIVYEASKPNSQKCASTQTPPSTSNSDLPEVKLNDFMEHANKGKRVNTYEHSNINVSLQATQKERRMDVLNKNQYNLPEKTNHVAISNQLKEVIVNHRRNSTVFEFSPPKENGEESVSSGVSSWRNVDSSGEAMTSMVSELVKKLEQTNVVRQSLKSNDCRSYFLRNVTQRKKPSQPPEKLTSGFSELSAIDEYQHSCPQNEIGYVLTDSTASSKKISSHRRIPSTTNFESPPSIGFILDNLDETGSQTRGSSLFSDIASDVEAYSTPGHKVDDVMTEDENPSCSKYFSRHSSSSSLYPYVSCEEVSTRECELREVFQSCLAKHSSETKTPVTNQTPEVSATPVAEQSMTTDADSFLRNVESNQTTPINPRLVTSTPERLSSGGEETSFSSAVDRTSDPGRLKWVEAKVVSSSDEEEYVSISEEYEYTDMDEGVVLIEKRYLPGDLSISKDHKKKQLPNLAPSSTSEESEASTISRSEGAYDTDELRHALHEYGFTAGPINGNTKRIYLRKLKRCKKKPQPPPQIGQPAYSLELLKTLDAPCEHLIYEWSHLEDSMSASFICGRRAWREGQTKTSFTYLLLDPRLSVNLPARAQAQSSTQVHGSLWAEFLRSVFYVGKGKRSRPYAHLYKAVAVWQQQQPSDSRKIQRILDIWKSGLGVVCLHVFLNIIPVEAFTREAAMISALTLPQLTNEKAGEFYGSASCWNLRLKRRLGCVLLHRACKVFLAEGERQLRPADID